MKKVLHDTLFFRVLGLKKQVLACAIGLSVSLGTISVAEAAPTRNTNPPTLQANAPNIYVVKKGDTLWDISKKFLKNPLRWPEIWASNKHVKNPHWIYPGDRLLMCSYNGKPLIGKDEGDGCEGIIKRYTGNTITLQPQVRIEELNNAISVIPLDDIKQWLDRSVIVSPTTTINMPYVLGMADKRVIAAKGQNIYVRGQGLVIGQRYGIYEEGKPYIITNTDGKKVNAGLELTQVASGIATNTENDITTLEITDSYNKEIHRKDIVLPEHEVLYPSMFYPVGATDVPANGKIIRIHGTIGAATKRGIVTIDRGNNQGTKVGHVFTVNQAGQIIKDPKTNQSLKLPTERIGTIMVIQTFDDLSYAYVLDSELPIYIDATLTPPFVLD